VQARTLAFSRTNRYSDGWRATVLSPLYGELARSRSVRLATNTLFEDGFNLNATAEGKTMADEVTKKDLQSLQGYVNKQLKEIEGRIKKAEDNISILKDVPTKQDEAISKLLMDITDNHQKQIWALRDEIAALKKN
jgi:hypothetical protein